MCRQLDEIYVSDKRIQIIKELIYELRNKWNILVEDGIMEKFNGVDVDQNRLCVKTNRDTYICSK